MKFEVLSKAPIVNRDFLTLLTFGLENAEKQRDADHQFYQQAHQEIVREILGRINFVFTNNEVISEEEWQAVREIITEKYLVTKDA